MTEDLTTEALVIYNDFLSRLQSAADLPEAELRQLFDSLCQQLDNLPDDLALKLLEFVDDDDDVPFV